MNRYSTHGAETEFEPGSRERVLRNFHHIRSVREMARVESQALYAATQRLIDETAPDHRFTVDDICHMHQLWLGDVYPWAGQYRSVNIAKGDFMFAAADQVGRLMQRFESEQLREFTPCLGASTAQQAEALAVVHAELVLIHPFREGNGRCARILSTLMGMQAGLPPLDFSGIEGRGKRGYIAAIHSALARDYAPMIRVFESLIARSQRALANDESR